MESSQENKLFSKINNFNTEEILKLWAETENQLTNKYIFDVRENILKVLEVRHPKQFSAWINAEYPNDNINNYFEMV